MIGLCYFLENRIGDRPAAEDIATECFFKAFQRITDFKTISKLKSFLYTAANNAAIDHINAKKRHNASHNEIEYLSRPEVEDVEMQFIRSEVLQSIYRESDNLPVQSREVIRLSLLEGKSINEVAEEMKISYKTVQHYKTLGLKSLRLTLTKDQLLTFTILISGLPILIADFTGEVL